MRAVCLANPKSITISATPEHRNLVRGDPACEDWERRRDDPDVVALRRRLEQVNGLPELELVRPDDVERAVELFTRDGFVAVRDALPEPQLRELRAATSRVLGEIIATDPDCSAGGGAGGLPHRYSFGSCSASRHMLHEPAWCGLIDLPATTPILEGIFGSRDFIVGGSGGDCVLPGAIEHQHLHSDNLWVEPHDPGSADGASEPAEISLMRTLPTPVVTINFCVQALTRTNGPIRQCVQPHTLGRALRSLTRLRRRWTRACSALAFSTSAYLCFGWAS